MNVLLTPKVASPPENVLIVKAMNKKAFQSKSYELQKQFKWMEYI